MQTVGQVPLERSGQKEAAAVKYRHATSVTSPLHAFTRMVDHMAIARARAAPESCGFGSLTCALRQKGPVVPTNVRPVVRQSALLSLVKAGIDTHKSLTPRRSQLADCEKAVWCRQQERAKCFRGCDVATERHLRGARWRPFCLSSPKGEKEVLPSIGVWLQPVLPWSMPP